jgi:hypothetical protein
MFESACRMLCPMRWLVTTSSSMLSSPAADAGNIASSNRARAGCESGAPAAILVPYPLCITLIGNGIGIASHYNAACFPTVDTACPSCIKLIG